ncbi:hypothetical protein LSTR_LSTR000786 [Laodelphax striatellus]|uniref:Uncharacterized protein n=1 Tax=Laodelphax striatellus TaxID=195883 RepID=A0A482XGH5_LAOST|nr:hypothetical protein LSTR_LSTR000786 [Laodelphax striatellus]
MAKSMIVFVAMLLAVAALAQEAEPQNQATVAVAEAAKDAPAAEAKETLKGAEAVYLAHPYAAPVPHVLPYAAPLPYHYPYVAPAPLPYAALPYPAFLRR